MSRHVASQVSDLPDAATLCGGVRLCRLSGVLQILLDSLAKLDHFVFV